MTGTFTGHLVVVTPWYPTEDRPYHGVFVREAVAALGDRPAGRTLVVHLMAVAPDEVREPRRERVEGVEVLRVGVGVPPRTPRHAVARAMRDTLARLDLPELAAADVVHAHVAVPAAWAVAGVLPPGTRLVTTEHATFVPEVLRTPDGARMYREVLARSGRLFAVGEEEARRLRRRFPEHRDVVVTGGNPVDPGRLALRPAPPEHLDRWLYLGNLVARKGVDRLLRGLRAWVDAHPGRPTHLRVVGDGPERPALEALVVDLGLEDRVDLDPGVPPEEVPGVLAGADVLLHLAGHETFGLTVVEAAVTGLPVVVTACGGPEDTLADAAARGLVRFVPLEHRPADLVRAVEALERTTAAADLAVVRQHLLERHGTARFANDLERAYAGAPAHDPPSPGAPVVVVLGLAPGSVRDVARLVVEAADAGARPVLVTDQPGEAVAADPRAAVVDLTPWVRRRPAHLVEDVVVGHVPRAVLRAVRRGSALVARLPGPQRRFARRGVTAAGLALDRHEVLAVRVRRRTHRLVHARLDPGPVARRVVRRHLGDVARDGGPAVVVHVDDEAAPLAAALAERFPGADVLVRPTPTALRHRLAR